MMLVWLPPASLTLCLLWSSVNFCWSARTIYKIPPPLEEEEWEITCYTCNDASNNSICNRLAVDRPCPKGTDYCHSLHILTEDGTSVVVNKKCASKSECRPTDVGCFNSSIPHQKMCVSCCDVQYCNDFIPTNSSSAILLTTRISGGAKSRPFHVIFYLVLFLFYYGPYTILQ